MKWVNKIVTRWMKEARNIMFFILKIVGGVLLKAKTIYSISFVKQASIVNIIKVS